jgi:peptide/nickel transport system permease protein
MVIAFTVKLHWFQTGVGPLSQHLVLPAICLALPAVGRLAMLVRSSMIDELNAHYVKVLRAKGMPTSRILAVHALRNAGIPYVTLAGWEIIRALAGFTVVVETVFAWPGIGFMAREAIAQQDFYLIQAIVFVVAVMVVVLNILIDISYKLLDPRVKLG